MVGTGFVVVVVVVAVVLVITVVVALLVVVHLPRAHGLAVVWHFSRVQGALVLAPVGFGGHR